MDEYNGQVRCLEDGCAWESEEIVRDPLGAAAEHSREAGHQVSIEIIISQHDPEREGSIGPPDTILARALEDTSA